MTSYQPASVGPRLRCLWWRFLLLIAVGAVVALAENRGSRAQEGAALPKADLRYETGRRDTGETIAFLKTAKASIRLRVVDSRFERLPHEKRDAMVGPHLETLPEQTQADIMNLFTFAPSELQQTSKPFRESLLNTEFEDPSPSIL